MPCKKCIVAHEAACVSNRRHQARVGIAPGEGTITDRRYGRIDPTAEGPYPAFRPPPLRFQPAMSGFGSGHPSPLGGRFQSGERGGQSGFHGSRPAVQLLLGSALQRLRQLLDIPHFRDPRPGSGWL